MISRVDWQLGRLMQQLEAIGEMDNTIVLYFTDHGEYAGDFDLAESGRQVLIVVYCKTLSSSPDPGSNRLNRSHFYRDGRYSANGFRVAEISPDHTHFEKSLVPVLADANSELRDRAFSRAVSPLLNLISLNNPADTTQKAALQHEQPEVVGKAVSMRTRNSPMYRLYETTSCTIERGTPQKPKTLQPRTQS